MSEDIKRLVSAVNFAALKHTNQRRKNPDAEPYINHPIGVMNMLVEIGEDVNVLMAAVLHDTVEDTDTTITEIQELFGAVVAKYVSEVTDDKSLPSKERKELQVQHAPHISHGGKLVKLADKLYNNRDLRVRAPVGWTQSRIEEYHRWSARVLKGLKGTNAALEAELEGVLSDYIT